MEAFVVLLIFLPAAIGIACLVGAIALLRRRPDRAEGSDAGSGAPNSARGVWIGCLLLVAFGIGACYANFFFNLRS